MEWILLGLIIAILVIISGLLYTLGEANHRMTDRLEAIEKELKQIKEDLEKDRKDAGDVKDRVYELRDEVLGLKRLIEEQKK